MTRVPTQGPSTSPANPVKVRSVPLAPPITVKFLGPLRGMLTHWQRGHSVPCDGPEKCPSSIHRSGTFFKAYAPVEEWISHLGRWRPFVLEATAHLEEYLRGRLLRGEVWLLSRDEGEKATRAVLAAYLETIPEVEVSPAFDILPVLQRLFNRLDLLLDVPNPTPRPVVLGDVAAPPPHIPTDLLPPPPVAEDPAERAKVRELLENAKKRFGQPYSGSRSAGDHGQKPSPAPPSGNGSAGNGHF